MSDVPCEEFRELVSAFVDERLDGAELLRLEGHVQTCAGCRAFEDDLRRYRGLLHAAEALHPLRRPPPGFAAMVAARAAGQPRAQVIPFPEVHDGRRSSRVSWIGLVAAAAAAVVFFAWSLPKLLPPEQKIVREIAAPSEQRIAREAVVPPEGGTMDTWMREHAMLARDSTLLGSAEEIELARFHSDAVPGR